MSVRFQNVGKVVHRAGRAYELLNDTNLCIENDARVGILGGPKSGKTTLLRLICGTETPDTGIIKREGSVSWPIPLANFLVNTSSVALNIRFVQRLYGIKHKDFPRQIAELGGFRDFLNVELQKCPPLVKSQLTFALGIGMDFDIYLFDDRVGPPQKQLKDRATELFKCRTEGRGVVVASSIPAEVEAHCDSVFVLDDGRVTHFDDVKDGVSHFKNLMKAASEKQKNAEEAKGDDEGAGGTEETADGMEELAAAL
jgi:capsular polysaccharide transport system ATP-binding protein